MDRKMCFRVGILDIVHFMKQRKVKWGFGITRQGVLLAALYWIGHNSFFFNTWAWHLRNVLDQSALTGSCQIYCALLSISNIFMIS